MTQLVLFHEVWGNFTTMSLRLCHCSSHLQLKSCLSLENRTLWHIVSQHVLNALEMYPNIYRKLKLSRLDVPVPHLQHSVPLPPGCEE